MEYSAGVFMALVGTITGLGMFLQLTAFSVFAENIAYKIKLKYFRAAIEKDSSYYDLQNQNEMASKISKECSAITNGLGERIAKVNGGFMALVVGFACAMYVQT
jgi:ABC-type multidrug transport system fused ATPase/permease subunit